jgi:hypothetical protein
MQDTPIPERTRQRPESRQWPLEGLAAAQMLEAGRIDAAFIVASADEPMVRRLLTSPQIRVMSLAYAEALARRFPSGSPIDWNVLGYR